MKRAAAGRALGLQLVASQIAIAALFALGGAWKDGFVAPFAGLVFAAWLPLDVLFADEVYPVARTVFRAGLGLTGFASVALAAALGKLPRFLGHAALFVFNVGSALLWFPSID